MRVPRCARNDRCRVEGRNLMADFLKTVKERVLVYDGAMGTNIQKRNPTLDDYWGKENCSEVLMLSRPNIIRDIHAHFFRVDCDIVGTSGVASQNNAR